MNEGGEEGRGGRGGREGVREGEGGGAGEKYSLQYRGYEKYSITLGSGAGCNFLLSAM